MGDETRVLLVERDPGRALVLAGATVELCAVDIARTPAAARAALAERRYAAVVKRVCGPDESPEEAASIVRAAAACDPPAPVVVLTSPGEGVGDVPPGATALPLPMRSATLCEVLAGLVSARPSGASPV